MKTRTFFINLLIVFSSFIYAQAHAGSIHPDDETEQKTTTQKPQNSTPAEAHGELYMFTQAAQQHVYKHIESITKPLALPHKYVKKSQLHADKHSQLSIQRVNISRQTIGSSVKSTTIKAETPLHKNKRQVTINARLSANSSTIVRENIQWKLYRTDSNYKITEHIGDRDRVKFKMSLDPGYYKITGELDYAKGEKSFKVPEGKGALEMITMPFKQAGQLNLTASLKRNGTRIKQPLIWNVYQNGIKVHNEIARKMNYAAPAGTYTLRVSLGKATKEQKITIKKGNTANQVIALDAGTVHLMAINDTDRSPVLSRINWSLKGKGTTIEPKANRATSVIIPAGNYTANANSIDGQNGKESFTIVAGESKRLKVLVR